MLTKVEVRRADGGHPTEWFPFYVGVTEPNGCDQHGGNDAEENGIPRSGHTD